MKKYSIGVVILVSLIALFGPASALYEDQAGKWDWRQRFVGKVKHITSYHLSSSQSVVVATEKNVLASLLVRNGTLSWRQILETRKAEPSADVINAISSGDGYYGLSEVVKPQSLLTISGNGRYFRSWDSKFGILEWEKTLPEEVLSGVEDGLSKLLFHIKSSKMEITVAKFNEDPRKLEVHVLDAKTGKTRQSPSINVGQWFSISDCEFVSKNYLVCIDQSTLALQFLAIGESTGFVPLSLSDFGLKADSKTLNLKLVIFNHDDESESPVFAVDLGGDGFVVLRIQDKQIKLQKILPQAKAISVAPTNLPDDGVKPTYGVFVLFSKPEELKKKSEIETTQEFRIAVFDLDSWKDVKELNGLFGITAHSPVTVEKMTILPFFTANLVASYKILLCNSDHSIVMASSQGTVSWIREEALASIVSTEIIDLPLSDFEASIEEEFGFTANIATNFISRISTQVHQLQSGITRLSNVLIDIMNPVAPLKRPSDGEDDIDIALTRTGGTGLVRDYFGMHKMIVILSKPGKLFGLDSLTGKVVWSFHDENLGEHLGQMSRKLPIYSQRSTAHYPHKPVSTLVTKGGLILSFNPITGEVVDKVQKPEKIKQTLLMSHSDGEFLKGLVTLSENNHVSVYPSSALDVFLSNKDAYYMLVANDKTGLLQGYSLSSVTKTSPSAKTAWSLSIPQSDYAQDNRMDIFFKRQNEHVHSQGRVLGDRNVLYKYLNPNLVTVVTEGAEGGSAAGDSPASKAKPHYINLYLLDAVTGHVIYTTTHKRCRGPVHLAHTENSIIYSYYNDKSRRTEISSMELYEGYTQANSSAFSSIERPFIRPPVVEHATFIFPTGMVAMTDTQTEKGITNKHLLIALPSGQLLELPKAFVDPRRPLNPTMEHKEEGLIPYIPELPVPSEGMINYNQSLMLVNSIDVGPAGLESTCLVFTYGLDIFYTRVTPSKTFDILKDDFDFLLIAAVLVILISLAYFSKWLAAKKALKSAWK
ncbi:ER membrane protein complex subunit 1 [Halotydeus destructor]|nr:ER membrane protein complex subunit 1 [Halotydeus destructor]